MVAAARGLVRDCLLGASSSRADPGKTEWRVLKDLLPTDAATGGAGGHFGHAGPDHGGQRPLRRQWHHGLRPCLGASAEKEDTSTRSHPLARDHQQAPWPKGCPSAFHPTVSEAADRRAHDTLIALPEQAPKALSADRGYGADTSRAGLAGRNVRAVIPGRSDRRMKIGHDRTLSRQRNRIARMFAHLRISRAIAARHDQRADSFMSTSHITTARYPLKSVQVT